jgi:hypothetical protein
LSFSGAEILVRSRVAAVLSDVPRIVGTNPAAVNGDESKARPRPCCRRAGVYSLKNDTARPVRRFVDEA